MTVELDLVTSSQQDIAIGQTNVDEVDLTTKAQQTANLVEREKQTIEFQGAPAPGTPGVGLPAGGNVGQLPFKQSADDYDVGWEDLITCKQSDLYGYQAASEDATFEYIFKEDKDGNWLIVRLNKTTDVATYSRGTGGYASVYVDADSAPSGSHTWASYGATF